jgi:ferredoxin-NADP reductase
VGGGSGVVPLMAMLRHRRGIGLRTPAVLLFSVRTPDEVIYQAELEAMAQADPTFTLLLDYTRQAPANWTGYQRRIDAAMLAEIAGRFTTAPQCFVCGPTGLVESVANGLQAAGLPPESILTERFGPSGG